MPYGIVAFVCWTGTVALAAAFALSLASKWGWLEWAQVHAPTEFIHRLLSCRFCTSWWTCVAVAGICALASGEWAVAVTPVCATLITRELW